MPQQDGKSACHGPFIVCLRCSITDIQMTHYTQAYALLARHLDLSCCPPPCIINKQWLSEDSLFIYFICHELSPLACVHIKAVSLEDKHSATSPIPHTTLLTDVGKILSDCNSDNTSDAYDSTINDNT